MTHRLMTVIALVLGMSFSASQIWAVPPILVDDDQITMTPDGDTWATAYPDLQDALTEAASTGADQIWIAQGTYHPDSGSGSRTMTLQLVDGVFMRGGFKGLSDLSDPNTQVLDASLTILSGDLDEDDDDPTTPDRTENSLVVVTAGVDATDTVGDSTRLEYLTIADGNHIEANSTGANGDGAGIVINAGSNPTIEHCIIRNNTVPTTYQGSGILVKTDDLGLPVLISDTIMQDNSAGRGGGLCALGSKVELNGCTMTLNELNTQDSGLSTQPAVYGGGFYLDSESDGEFRDCIISDNTWNSIGAPEIEAPAYGAGGASEGVLFMKRCSVTDNALGEGFWAAPAGGGVFASGSVVIVDCTFTGNLAAGKFASVGGGLAIGSATTTADVVNCVFSENQAGYSQGNAGFGGAIYLASEANLTNLLLHSNTSFGYGGGIYDEYGGSVITNCTVTANAAILRAVGGMHLFTNGDRQPTVTNCIAFGNTDESSSTTVDEAQIYSSDSQNLAKVTHSCIQDDVGDSTIPYNVGGVTSNIDDSPMFGTNYTLSLSSPCVDTGDNVVVPADGYDVDENNDTGEPTPDLIYSARIVYGGNTGSGVECLVDMGAFELGSQCDLDEFGDLNNDGNRDGLDIQGFVDCILTTPVEDQECVCYRGDFRNEDGVNIIDIPPFVACILSGGTDCDADFCPVEGGGGRTAPPDCNSNGVPDDSDITSGTSSDCNDNGIPDECDIANETSADANENSIPDECEPDCNENDVPDDIDIADETSDDCDENGVPDECDQDCDNNDVPDACEMTGNDCDANGIFDACELDCDGDGITNACELSGNDCNGNTEPDDCEVNRDPPWNLPDCNNNDVPDECELSGNDCNENGILDECDIANEVSDDENENGIPDECETESMMGGGSGSSMMMAGGVSSGDPEFDEADAWESYFEWCAATDFSSMNNAAKFSAALTKRLELGLPAGQMLPE